MYFIIHSLQCNHKVPESQLTVHIIAHHHKVRNHMDVYKHLTSWVPLHMDWISVVGKDFLAEQKLHPEDFANNIVNPDIPMDELGLLITACMYHMHFGVVMNDHVWNMTDDNSGKVTKFNFMFCGDHRFLDTCTGNWNLPSPPLLLLDISRSEQQSPINHAGEEGQKMIQSTGNKFTVPLDLRNVNELASDKEIEEHETDSDDQKMEENHDKDSENPHMEETDHQKKDSEEIDHQKMDSEEIDHRRWNQMITRWILRIRKRTIRR